MNQINLLPWRQEKKETAQQAMLLWLAICLVCGVCCAYGVSEFRQKQVDDLKKAILALSHELAGATRQLDTLNMAKTDIDSMQQRLVYLEELKHQQFFPATLFDALVIAANEHVQFTHVDYTLLRTLVTGYALDYRSVDEFANKLKQTAVVKQVQILSVVRASSAQYYQFSVEFSYVEKDEG